MPAPTGAASLAHSRRGAALVTAAGGVAPPVPAFSPGAKSPVGGARGRASPRGGASPLGRGGASPGSARRRVITVSEARTAHGGTTLLQTQLPDQYAVLLQMFGALLPDP